MGWPGAGGRGPGGGAIPTMAYTGRLRPKEMPFSGYWYMKGQGNL